MGGSEEQKAILYSFIEIATEEVISEYQKRRQTTFNGWFTVIFIGSTARDNLILIGIYWPIEKMDVYFMIKLARFHLFINITEFE